jgi:cell division septum initiation protein DivIVA
VKFDIERKGYKKTEVDEYIFSLKNDYESKLTEQKNRIFQLRNELDEKEKKISVELLRSCY